MPKGDKNIAHKGVKFSKDYQPSPKAKSDGKKRIANFKEAMIYFGETLKKQINIDGEDVELTYESNVAFELMKKANNGDLKAIEILTKIQGWNAPTKVQNEVEVKQNEVLDWVLKKTK